MRRKTYSKLDVMIRYEKQHRAYRIIVDGDVFWADTYEHAIIRLFYILFRDEFLVRDCKCTNKVDAFEYDSFVRVMRSIFGEKVVIEFLIV